MNLVQKDEIDVYDSSDNTDSNNDDDNDIKIPHYDYLKYKSRTISLTDSNFTKDSSSNTFLPDNQINRECFVSQNIVNYEQLLKVIVIGKTGAGKSLFIQSLLQQDRYKERDNIPTLNLAYSPTLT